MHRLVVRGLQETFAQVRSTQQITVLTLWHQWKAITPFFLRR